MRHIYLSIITIIAVSIIGCASNKMTFSEFQAKGPSLEPDKGRIFFYRPTGAAASLRPSILLDKNLVGNAVAYGFFHVDLPPGEHQVITVSSLDRKKTLHFTLEKSQTVYIRLLGRVGFNEAWVYAQQVDEAEAMKQIQNCNYTDGL